MTAANKPRILFLPMDGRGLGHLNRACKLARAMQGVAACMIGTGLRYADSLVPETCEYVRIPGLDGLFESRAAERGKLPFIDIPAREALEIRREFLRTLEQTFKPDLIVTDLLPAGPYNELAEILAKSPAKKFIVFRSAIGREGIQSVADFGLDALVDVYDAFLIASDPQTASSPDDLRFTGRERSRCRYIGYVSLPISKDEIESARVRRGLKPGDRWVVCSAGAGLYERDLIERCMDLAKEFSEIHFDIVAGPSCLSWTPSAEPSVFFDGRVRVSHQRADLRVAHAAADIVICHGGYNTLTEAMEGGAELIVQVRNDPSLERGRHARRLQRHHPISVVEDAGELRASLRAALARAPKRQPARKAATLQFDGCGEFKRLVLETLAPKVSANRRRMAIGSRDLGLGWQ
jgi:predicted glycosyltransferase